MKTKIFLPEKVMDYSKEAAIAITAFIIVNMDSITWVRADSAAAAVRFFLSCL